MNYHLSTLTYPHFNISSVFPEISSKFSRFLFGVVTGGFCLWSVANVLLNYSIYYDIENSLFVNIVFGIQYILFFIYLSTSILWTRLWLQRQVGERWELTLEEFSFLFFAVFTFLYSMNGSIWAYATNNTIHRNRTEANSVFLVGNSLLYATLLVGDLY